MANQEVNFKKQVYGKVSYPKVINTSFEELVAVEETPLAFYDN